MKINENKIILEHKDYSNNFKRLKKYKDKDYKIISKGTSEDIKAFIKAFNEKDLLKRYSYIYDYMCEYLTNLSCKHCDFKNDMCKANRSGAAIRKENGCCYFRKEGLCKFLVDKKCTRPNITCKLFMCPTIEKEVGFSSLPKNYLLLKYFFNIRQRQLLRYSFRKTKQELLEKLIQKNNNV